jgi:hypothetical protein
MEAITKTIEENGRKNNGVAAPEVLPTVANIFQALADFLPRDQRFQLRVFSRLPFGHRK